MFITVTGQAEGRHSTLASIAVAGRTGAQRESRTRSSGWLAGAIWGGGRMAETRGGLEFR